MSIVIPEGYKTSALGPIPLDWEVKDLGEVSEIKGQYGINAAAVDYSDRLPTYLRITDIDDDGNFIAEEKKSVDDENSAKFILDNNDIVFARTGATVGKTYLHNKVKNGDLVFAGFLIRFRTNINNLLPFYLKSFTNTKVYWDWVKTVSMRSGQPGINSTEYCTLKIPLPPIFEQKAIAILLGLMDDNINKTNQLISKKELQKKALMQQLLTGKKRLKGFDKNSEYKATILGLIPRDWDVKKIGNITKTIAGGTPSTAKKEYWGGDIKWMNSGELNLKKVFNVEGRITEQGLKNSNARLIPKKSVLIGLAGQGKTRGTIAMNMIELCTNQSVAAILPSKYFVEDYLYYNLDFRYFELRQLSTGDGGRGGLNLNIINSVFVPLPSVPEQTAIAQVLQTADKEIQLLKAKADKLKEQKKGMMQVLLTGRKRLKIV